MRIEDIITVLQYPYSVSEDLYAKAVSEACEQLEQFRKMRANRVLRDIKVHINTEEIQAMAEAVQASIAGVAELNIRNGELAGKLFAAETEARELREKLAATKYREETAISNLALREQQLVALRGEAQQARRQRATLQADLDSSREQLRREQLRREQAETASKIRLARLADMRGVGDNMAKHLGDAQEMLRADLVGDGYQLSYAIEAARQLWEKV